MACSSSQESQPKDEGVERDAEGSPQPAAPPKIRRERMVEKYKVARDLRQVVETHAYTRDHIGNQCNYCFRKVLRGNPPAHVFNCPLAQFDKAFARPAPSGTEGGADEHEHKRS